MEEHSEDKTPVDMASRIEKTLTDREQARLKELPVTIGARGSEPSTRKASYFNYMMLLLGVVVGTLIGVALYFIIPAPGSTASTKLPLLNMAKGLEEADRLLATGQAESAKKSYLGVISKGTTSPRPYNNLASLYAAEGDLDQAQLLLKQALETDPDYLTVYRNVGMVYAAMARDSYGKALQLTGDTIPVRLQPLGLPAKVPPVAQEVISRQEVKGPVFEVTAAPEIEEPVQAIIAETREPAPVPLAKAELQPPVEVNTDMSASAEPGSQNGTFSVVAVGADSENSTVSEPVVTVSAQQLLEQWAMAWASQDVDAYLKCYESGYSPEGDLTPEAWREKRHNRLTAPSFIEVALDSVEVISESGGIAKVNAVQTYRSDRYQDRTQKSFVLRRSGQTWVIIEERSLGRVR